MWLLYYIISFVSEPSMFFSVSHDLVTMTVTCNHHTLTLDSNKKKEKKRI